MGTDEFVLLRVFAAGKESADRSSGTFFFQPAGRCDCRGGDRRSLATMIQRFDTIAVDLPVPNSANPAAAAAVQELMGGKFGERSTLMNYTFPSFNTRGKEESRPFYDLVCNIATEEYSHIEAAAAAFNLLLAGATERADRNATAGGATKCRKVSLSRPRRPRGSSCRRAKSIPIC